MERKNTEHGKIEVKPGVLGGKPVFAGTRIPVDLVLDFLANSWDFSKILAEYSSLVEKDLQAAVRFASKRVRGERFHLVDFSENSAPMPLHA